jgi:hypothetical protein
VPGRFGARASPLLEFLDERHHGVRLSPEDFRRFTIWHDTNSKFYEAYEGTAVQAWGEIVRPSPE